MPELGTTEQLRPGVVETNSGRFRFELAIEDEGTLSAPSKIKALQFLTDPEAASEKKP